MLPGSSSLWLSNRTAPPLILSQIGRTGKQSTGTSSVRFAKGRAITSDAPDAATGTTAPHSANACAFALLQAFASDDCDQSIRVLIVAHSRLPETSRIGNRPV